jgi:hypothetical protein
MPTLTIERIDDVTMSAWRDGATLTLTAHGIDGMNVTSTTEFPDPDTAHRRYHSTLRDFATFVSTRRIQTPSGSRTAISAVGGPFTLIPRIRLARTGTRIHARWLDRTWALITT